MYLRFLVAPEHHRVHKKNSLLLFHILNLFLFKIFQCEEHLAGMVVTNGKHNGTCKLNGDSSYNNGVEDTSMAENKNGSPHSNSSEVEQMDNDEVKI